MAPLLRACPTQADSVKGSADHLDTSGGEMAHPPPATRKSKAPASKQKGPVPPTEAPMSEAKNPTSPEPRSYLLELLKKKIIEKHEKPVRHEYHEDLKALGQGRGNAHSGHAAAWDWKSLEETATLKMQAGPQSDIAKDFQTYMDLLISEYQPFAGRVTAIDEMRRRVATIKRDNETRARGEPVMFTRAEVAEAHKVWEAKRIALGLPVQGDCDDLAPPERVDE